MNIRGIAGGVLLGLACAVGAGQQVHGGHGVTLPPPPATEQKPVDEQIGGHTVVDPYQWLEDQQSPETRAWITAQNSYTARYLDQVSDRTAISDALGKLERVDRVSVPVWRAGRLFYEKRLAAENQASIYMRTDVHTGLRTPGRVGTVAAEHRHLDPARLGDPDTSVAIADVSDDGRLLLYAVRHGGADEAVYRVLRVPEGNSTAPGNTPQDLPDTLPLARYSGVSLAPDGKGLFYARFSQEGTRVYYHAFGTDAGADALLFGGQFRGETLGEMALIYVSVSDSGHWLFLSIARGVPATREDILVKDLRTPGSPFVPLVYGIEAHMSAV